MEQTARRSTSVTPPPAVAVVVSRYNRSITKALLDGALGAFEAAGGKRTSVAVYHAPGSFELPALALAAAESGRYKAVVALGCLIRGQTRHDRYIAGAVAQGLTEVSLKTGVPVTFGVLTVDTPRQARARSGGKKGNKGADAMSAALDAAACIAAISGGKPAWPAPKIPGKPAKLQRTHDKAARSAVSRPRRAARAVRISIAPSTPVGNPA